MANNITVSWQGVTNFVLGNNNTGLSSATYTNLLNNSTGRSVLDFGNVQAGKITDIRCVVARFSGASSVGNINFWLESTNANATGSQNTNLGTSDWEFYYCIVPQSKLNFNITAEASEPGGISEYRKRGKDNENNVAYLGPGFYMTEIPRSVESVPNNQFTADNSEPVTMEIQSGGHADSYLIFLDVQTSSNAYSGNTEGWCYRMNFLYS